MPPTSCSLTYAIQQETYMVQLPSKEVILGRDRNCGVVIGHAAVSLKHAKIRPHKGGWFLEDLKSRNGSFVNGRRVRRAALTDGDKIRVGKVDIRCHIRPPETGGMHASVVLGEFPFSSGTTHSILIDEFNALLEATAPRKRIARPQDAPPTEPETAGMFGDAAWLMQLFKKTSEALLSTSDLVQTVERVLDLVLEFLPAERCSISLYDDATGAFTPLAARVRGSFGVDEIRISTSIARQAVQERRAVLAQDLAGGVTPLAAPSVRELQLRAAMCTPLCRGSKVIGLIYADTQQGGAFDADHLEVLAILATASAVAVHEARLRSEIQTQKMYTERLSRYHSAAIVERILDGPDSQAMLAEERNITVLFADLCDFTSLSESLSPQEVVDLLNTLFEALTEAVFACDGTLDKFVGDGLMAFFGAPLRREGHAQAAVRAGLLMQRAVQALDASHPLALRIGINTGHAVVGDVGSPKRKDYTAIGDAVNVASRLEATVARRGQVVIGPATYDLVCNEFRCQPLRETKLTGKSRLIVPYLVRGPADTPEVPTEP